MTFEILDEIHSTCLSHLLCNNVVLLSVYLFVFFLWFLLFNGSVSLFSWHYLLSGSWWLQCNICFIIVYICQVFLRTIELLAGSILISQTYIWQYFSIWTNNWCLLLLKWLKLYIRNVSLLLIMIFNRQPIVHSWFRIFLNWCAYSQWGSFFIVFAHILLLIYDVLYALWCLLFHDCLFIVQFPCFRWIFTCWQITFHILIACCG